MTVQGPGSDAERVARGLTRLMWLGSSVLWACGDAASPADAGLASVDVFTADAGRTDVEFADVEIADAEALDAPGLDAAATDAEALDVQADDAGRSEVLQPILFIHGINGSSDDFSVMRTRLSNEGWPESHLRAITFPDPRWGCNLDNATIVEMEANALLASTGASRIDLVAHSMGALSTRYYLKNLGGTEKVSTYVTLGGLHHGQRSACLNPLPVCVWQELCPTHEYLMQLNEDPVTPGDLHWVSIYSDADTLAPPDVARLDGAENIELSGIEHAGPNGLTERIEAYDEVLRVLRYPSP